MSNLKFHDDDWTVNIKKGFISLFEINMEKRLELGDKTPPVAGRSGSGFDTTQKHFTVMEVSGGGGDE